MVIKIDSNTHQRKQHKAGRKKSWPSTQIAKNSSRLPLPVILLLVGLVIPFIIIVGPLRLSVYRLVLLVFFLPVLFAWLRKDVGPIRLTDIALLFFCLWSTLSYAVVHNPMMSLERGGIIMVETMGAYLFGRYFIRNADDFSRMVQLLFWIIAALLPFAAYEALTGHNILMNLFDTIYPSYMDIYKEPRWGMRRVQGTFEHPILFGVFCGSITGLTYLVLGYKKPFFTRLARTVTVIAAALFSLSSGPLIAVFLQVLLLLWNGFLHRIKQRWTILLGLFLVFWLVVKVASNRSMPQIIISLLAFNTSTAWNRLRIWEYGSASVLKHPVFGIGLNDWERAPWMVSSVDMFWLVPAMRHGIPSGLALQVALFAAILGILLKKGLNDRQNQFRIGFLISMAGFYISGWTVHYWNATYVLFMFLMGSGVWLMNATPEESDSNKEPLEGAEPSVRAYSRFPNVPTRSVDIPKADRTQDASRRRELGKSNDLL